LELGTGWYSTPILHEIALASGRRLISQEADAEWRVKMVATFIHPLHEITAIDRELWRGKWGLVFVDHGPSPDRARAVLDLLDRTDVFVLHDTEPASHEAYGWTEILPLFKYSHTDATHPVHTTILSNVARVDLVEWTMVDEDERWDHRSEYE
jgi:hypothetical protein